MATTVEQVVDYGKWLSAQYGLRVTSHVRTPERNRAVGGAPRSDHLTGLGIDLAGDPERMESLAEWARANMGPGKMFRYVEYGTDDHGDHVHLSFNKDATIPATGTAATPQREETVVTAATAPGTGRPDITADTPPEQIEEYIRTYYPDVAPFLGRDEFKMLLYAAAINDWDDRKLDAAIEQTQYWKTTTPEHRQFDALLASDRRAAEQLIDRAKGVLSDVASQYGVPLDDTALGEAAKQAIKAGWIGFSGQVTNSTELGDWIASGLREAPIKSLTGQPAVNAAALGRIASQYLIPIDSHTLNEWAIKIIDGSATEDTFRQYVAGLARGQWTNDKDVVSAIDSGLAPAEFFAPHRNLIAQRLEMAPEQVDLMAPRFREVTQFWDGKQRRSMTLGELDQKIRGWVRAMPDQEQPMWWREEKGAVVSRFREWAGVA